MSMTTMIKDGIDDEDNNEKVGDNSDEDDNAEDDYEENVNAEEEYEKNEYRYAQDDNHEEQNEAKIKSGFCKFLNPNISVAKKVQIWQKFGIQVQYGKNSESGYGKTGIRMRQQFGIRIWQELGQRTS